MCRLCLSVKCITSITHKIMPIFPDCYDQWSLVKYVYDGDHKSYETLFEGTEEE